LHFDPACQIPKYTCAPLAERFYERVFQAQIYKLDSASFQ
jgi:hypothetical protein